MPIMPPEDQSSSESEMAVDPEECKAEQAEQLASRTKKKAGMPELDVDALPSALASKVMSLIYF